MRSLYALVWRNLTAHTTLISVAEGQRELGLLRAAGATRRQVMAVVAGERALVGLLIAPLICAGAAWLPSRSILRSPVIETITASAE